MNQPDEPQLGGGIPSTRAPDATPTLLPIGSGPVRATVPAAGKPASTNRRIQQKDFPDGPKLTPFQTPSTIENVEHMLADANITVRYTVIKK